MNRPMLLSLGMVGLLAGIVFPALTATRAARTTPELSPDRSPEISPDATTHRSGSAPVAPQRLPAQSANLLAAAPSKTQRTAPAPPPRLTIKVTLAEPEDLKIAVGDAVQVGQVMADRSRERDRLQSRKRNLELSLQRLKTATISPPLPPSAVPLIADLPDQSYLEQQAAIAKAQTDVDQAERAIALKQQEIEYLRQLDNLNPLVLEHEQAKLAQLQRDHTATVRNYQLAVGQLGAAQNGRAYREYEHRITLAERIEQQNRAALEYQQQLAAYEQRLRDRDFQAVQTQLQIDELTNAIESLAVVKAPYSGKVRRIKWLGQNPDGSLTAELTLLVRPSAPSPSS